MVNLVDTYQNIADILSYKSPNDELEKKLSDSGFNWDAIVVEGSKHLILPTIYCRLKSKKLLYLLPQELIEYLEEITSINRNRNKTILKQIEIISSIFKNHNIEHVFLKGSALLISGCFKDIAERMVGDIDILISKPQLSVAFEILKNNGYDKSYGFAYETIGYRHLDRLISDKELAAVELHGDLLIEKYRNLIKIEDVLNSRYILNGVAIPSSYYLNMHQVLSWQLNNYGYFYKAISFKSIYDNIILNGNEDEVLLSNLKKLKFGQTYLSLAKYYFNEYNSILLKNYTKLYLFTHKNYLTNPLFRFILKPIKYGLINAKKRIELFFKNKFYRAHLVKKIFIVKK